MDLRPHTRRSRALVALALAFALTRGASASDTQDPMLTAGFAPQTVHEGDLAGSVNVLNGSLTLTLPIGPAYPVNEALSYRLTLTYSSHLRTWYADPVAEGAQYLRGRGPMGWGWVMHFGRIATDPFGDRLFAYQSPDGVWHPLYPTSDPATCVNDRGAGACFVTRDATFIRALRLGSTWHVWTPDGVERVLAHRVGDGWACGSDPWREPDGVCRQRPEFEGWYTTRITDPFDVDGSDEGASVNVVYFSTKPHCMRKVWDSVRGESAPTLEFQCADGPGPHDDGGVYTRIDVRNAMGAVSYHFPATEWTRPFVTPCPFPAPGSELSDLGRDVLRLTGITGPEGTTSFGYHPVVGVLDVVDHPGELARAEYDWSCVPYQKQRNVIRPPDPPIYEDVEALAVREKRVLRLGADDCDDDGADCWTYERVLSPSVEFHPCGPATVPLRTNPDKVVVRLPVQPRVGGAPDRSRDVYYFTVGCSHFDLESPNGLLRRVEHQRSSGAVVRREETEYDFEVDPGASPPGDEKHIDVRERRQTTAFVDAGGTYLVREHEGWDGRGHYRTTRERTNEGTGGAELVRRTDTDYCQSPQDLQEWFLGRHASRRVYAGDGAVLEQESLLDWDEFGRLWGTTTTGLNLEGGSPYGERRVLGFWSGHEKACEVRCGGDAGQACPPLLPAPGDCSGQGAAMRLPSCELALGSCTSPPPFFGTLQTYANGAVVTRRHLGASWLSEELERSASGAVLASFDSLPGYSRRMSYDAADRLVRVEFLRQGQPDEADLVLAYHARNDRVDWSRVWSGWTLVAGRLNYDEYGRRAASLAPNPAGGDRFRQYVKRDGLGNVTFRSDAHLESSAPTGSNYVDWDPLGRPGRVRRDGADQETFAYAGMATTHARFVGTGGGGREEAVEVTRQQDGFGRLVKVVEPAPGGGSRTTQYAHDALDRLLRVEMTGAEGTQVRSFVYDGLGNLRRAEEPESGTTVYARYDAMGNAVETRNARGTVLVRDFDCAGRLTRETTASGERRLGYDGPYPGRLLFDVYENLGGRTVRRDYGHEGRSGRQNLLRTTIARPGHAPYEFTQAIAWNELGLEGGIHYPQPFDERPPERRSTVVGQVFTAGLLTALLDGAEPLVSIPSYDPGGQPARLDFLGVPGAPAISLLREFDERNRIRRLLGTPGSFDTGLHVYDRAGNRTAIGADGFTYDRFGQLARADLLDLQGAPLGIDYGYDDFGNLRRRRGLDPVEIVVDSSTNRVARQVSPATPAWTYLPTGSVRSDGRNVYRWDGFERLASVEWDGGSVGHTYDADGHRAAVTAEVGCQAGERFYIRDAQGQVRSEYVSAPGCGRPTVWVRDYLLAGIQLVGEIRNAAVAPVALAIGQENCRTDVVAIAVASSSENACRVAGVELFQRVAEGGAYDFSRPAFATFPPDVVCPQQSRLLTPPGGSCYVARARHLSGELGPISNEVCDEGAIAWPCSENPIASCPAPLPLAAAEARKYYFTDHLGTPRVIVAASGAVEEERKLGPFGEPLEATSCASPRRAFTGHERDVETGLDYMMARYYSASHGRFVSVDPGDDVDRANPATWNHYGYVRNNPVNLTDPTGSVAETPFDLAMTAISIAQALARPSAANIAGAVVDVLATAIPGVPAVGGRLIDAAQAGDKVVDAARAANKLEDAQKVTEGVYEVTAQSGKVYVGQSKNVPRRLEQHVNSGKITEQSAASAKAVSVDGGKTAREVAEQTRIDSLGGIQRLENKCNPIGPKRAHLMKDGNQ